MARGRIYGTATSVIIYDSRVDALWDTRGPIGLYTNRIARRGQKYAKQEAPQRRGRMRRAIHGETARRGKRHRVARVRSKAYYSYWVHEGTSGSSGGGGLTRLRGQPGRKSAGKWRVGMAPSWKSHTLKSGAVVYKKGWPKFTNKPVAGQDANPFLERAMIRTMRDFT